MGSFVKTTPYSEITATLEVLAGYGISRSHLAMIRSDSRCAQRVAEAMLCCGAEKSLKHNRISALMEKNYFGVDDWIIVYGAQFSKEQLSLAAEFPWGEDVLNASCPFVKGKSIKETHFAFLGLDYFNGCPLTLVKWHALHVLTENKPKFYYSINPWYRQHRFAAKSTCELRWYLMPLASFPSRNENSDEAQLRFMPSEYESASAIEEITKAFLYYKKSGARIDYDKRSWCKDNTNDNGRVLIESFGHDGLKLESRDEGRWRHCGIGVALSRKLP